MKNVFSSYGTTETSKTSKTVTINITSNSSNNNNNSNSNNKGSSSSEQNKNTTLTNKGENIAQKDTLPKTGLNLWIGIGIVIAILGAIVGYIKYKKTY